MSKIIMVTAKYEQADMKEPEVRSYDYQMLVDEKLIDTVNITWKSRSIVQTRPLSACWYTCGSWWTKPGNPPFGQCWTPVCEPNTQTSMTWLIWRWRSRSHLKAGLIPMLSGCGRAGVRLLRQDGGGKSFWYWDSISDVPCPGVLEPVWLRFSSCLSSSCSLFSTPVVFPVPSRAVELDQWDSCCVFWAIRPPEG